MAQSDAPTLVVRLAAEQGREIVVKKLVAVYTSRDVEVARAVPAALECARGGTRPRHRPLLGGTWQAVTPRDLLPGARELLEGIRAAGLKTALGSASRNAGEVIDRLGIRALFDAVTDGYSVPRQKPAPDLFLHAAWQLGIQPRLCVVVEDAAAGIEAARVGGFRTVGIGPAERVGAAEVVLPDLDGARLRDILSALPGTAA